MDIELILEVVIILYKQSGMYIKIIARDHVIQCNTSIYIIIIIIIALNQFHCHPTRLAMQRHC